MTSEDINGTRLHPPHAFTTLEEVNAYLAQDPLPCLLCGKLCRTLQPHLQHKHQLSVQEYRDIFGIPRSRNLVCPSLSEHLREHAKQLRTRGLLWRDSPCRHPNYRETPKPTWSLVEATRRNLSATKQHITRSCVWQRHHYEEYLRRIAQGHSIGEVGRQPDMPSQASFCSYVNAHEDFRKAFEETLQNLSFKQQIRCHYPSKELKTALSELVESGCSWKEISWYLEIRASSAHKLWEKIQKEKSVAVRKTMPETGKAIQEKALEDAL